MLLLDKMKGLPFLIACFVLVVLATSRISMEFHDHRESVDGIEKNLQLAVNWSACQLDTI